MVSHVFYFNCANKDYSADSKFCMVSHLFDLVLIKIARTCKVQIFFIFVL